MSAAGEVRVRLSLDGKLLGRSGQAEKIRKMLEEGSLKRLRVTFVPRIVGGADSPTLLGVPSESLLQKSVRLRFEGMRPQGSDAGAVYGVTGRGKFASSLRKSPLKTKRCKRAIRKTN